jgi:protein-L-isoaspartate(D-aspartate) O-methyltransferase
MSSESTLAEARAFYAALLAMASRWTDPRLERAFTIVPREAFLPPGPWRAYANGGYVETPSANPVHLYQNLLIAIDASKGVNNGEPFLHASWIGAVAPQPGEVVTHIGAGLGYYSAILSLLVQPHGSVTAFEIDLRLAEEAERNLRAFESVKVVSGDATRAGLPASDIIYVNASVAAPPVDWLRALKRDGRLIFPWRPTKEIGLAMLVRAQQNGFSVTPLKRAWFIPCSGAVESMATFRQPVGPAEARSVRSLWRTSDHAPDETAVAVYSGLWFSSRSLDA